MKKPNYSWFDVFEIGVILTFSLVAGCAAYGIFRLVLAA